MTKVVTICGSMKYKQEMIELATELELEKEYVVIQCVYSNRNYNEKELDILSQIHFKKIEMSDAIYVVNIDGYIGNSTQKEIAYAKKLNKEILYFNEGLSNN